MRKYLTTLLAACCMLAAFSMPASALEYHFDGPDAGLFGRPTSDDTIYVTMDKPVNTDRSKNAAYIPPAFGSPTSYTLNAGELLTPNLVSGSATGVVNGTGGVTVLPPSACLLYTSVDSGLWQGPLYVRAGLHHGAAHGR